MSKTTNEQAGYCGRWGLVLVIGWATLGPVGAMAANLVAMDKQDEALATYQQIASANAGSFDAPMALIEEVHILQQKNRGDDARRICETIMTQYRDSYAAMEASQLLRTFLKSTKAQTQSVVTPSNLGSPASATVPPTIKVLPTAPPAPNSPSLPPAKPPAAQVASACADTLNALTSL
jgi:hypothetical protein